MAPVASQDPYRTQRLEFQGVSGGRLLRRSYMTVRRCRHSPLGVDNADARRPSAPRSRRNGSPVRRRSLGRDSRDPPSPNGGRVPPIRPLRRARPALRFARRHGSPYGAHVGAHAQHAPALPRSVSDSGIHNRPARYLRIHDARRLTTTLICLGVLAAAACVSERMHVPSVSDVDRISIHDNGRADTTIPMEVTDARRIERLLTFLREHNDRWNRPWDTPPIGKYAVILEGNGRPVVFMQWGKDWMSVSGPTATEPARSRIFVQPAHRQPLVRHLSKQDADQLGSILDVPRPE